MAIDIIGNMCLGDDGKYHPWWNICSAYHQGKMVLSEGKYYPTYCGLPFKEDASEDCYDICGYMKSDGNPYPRYAPTLRWNSYDTLLAMFTDCCCSCGSCYGEDDDPTLWLCATCAPCFVPVTFTGIRRCQWNGSCAPGALEKNGIYILEWVGACHWEYKDAEEDIDIDWYPAHTSGTKSLLQMTDHDHSGNDWFYDLADTQCETSFEDTTGCNYVGEVLCENHWSGGTGVIG